MTDPRTKFMMLVDRKVPHPHREIEDIANKTLVSGEHRDVRIFCDRWLHAILVTVGRDDYDEASMNWDTFIAAVTERFQQASKFELIRDGSSDPEERDAW